MSFNAKEKEIIQFGIENGKSKDDIKNAIAKYRTGFLPTADMPTTTVASDSPIQDIKETGKAIKDTIIRGADKVGEISRAKATGEQGGFRSFLQTFGVGAGTAAQVAGDAAIGVGKALLPQQAEDKIAETATDVATPIIQSDAVQTLIEKYDSLTPKQQRDLDAAFGVLNLGATVTGAGAAVKGAKAATKVASQAALKTSDALKGITATGANGIRQATNNALEPASIMQRVARISKGKQQAFQERAGQSVGQYLVDRKIFGDIDEITTQLFNRFNQSRTSVDKALTKLDGRFKSTAVGTALRQLADREANISSAGAVSKDLERVTELLKSNSRRGLTMSEINEVKRLYERNVKLDFLRDNVSDKIAQANNLDSAIRKFQFDKARELGFKNLPDLNRETMLAKQLLDDLGTEYAGSAGNNAISLTDWIILAGGDPTAVSSFVAKKALSNKGVMSQVAKVLSRNKPKTPDPKAEFGSPTIDGFQNFLKSIEGQTTQQ